MKVVFLMIVQVLIQLCYSIHQPCFICHDFISYLRTNVPSTLTYGLLEKLAVLYCRQKNIQDMTVCVGAIKQMTPSILSSLWKHYTDPHLICPELHICKQEYKVRNMAEEVKEILSDKPDKRWERPDKRKVLKVLHISDLHPDLYYTPGAEVKCKEPVCCRSNVTNRMEASKQTLAQLLQGKGTMINDSNVEEEAGYWGSVGACDLPLPTFSKFLSQIKDINPDAIIWTGDNTPHDIWAQTQSYNLNFTMMLADKIEEAVPDAIILPAMGNHESWPVNVYDFQGSREQVLNAGLSHSWGRWLDEKASASLSQKGYFSMTHPSLNNLKVISINTQAGNDQNWILLRDPTDPGKMLEWLEEELKESQKIEQYVYIIGHIPPGENLNEWSMRYNALIDRFSYLIRGQFYGHTHSDHLGFFLSMSEHKNVRTDPLSSYYLIAPSLTTYSNRMPEFRLMEVDYDTMQVLDYHQYRLDLHKFKHKEDEPKFQLLYSFLSAYGLDDMTVDGGMTHLRAKLRDDPSTQKLYTHFKSGGLSPGQANSGIICDTMTSPQFGAECHNSTLSPSQFQKYAGPWKTLNHS